MALNDQDRPSINAALVAANASLSTMIAKAMEILIEADKIKTQLINILTDIRD